MATYIPNALQATEPVESRTVESAALEFRTVKAELVKIDSVYDGMAAVTAVAANVAAINTANAGLAAINTVATNIADVTNFADVYLGPSATDPLVRADASPLQAGDLYFNTAIGFLKVYTGGFWFIAATDTALLVPRTSSVGSATLPAGTTAQRDSVPVTGFTRFNTTLNSPEVWNGTTWAPMGGGATGAPGNSVFVENDQAVTADYTLTANKNAMSAGPVTINAGVIVTIPTGATWTVV